MPIIPTKARYEAATKTIRSVPENYWLASMDSWDGAVDHERTALIFAAAPELRTALVQSTLALGDAARCLSGTQLIAVNIQIESNYAAIAKAEGKS